MVTQVRGEIEQLKIGIHGDIQTIALSAEDKCARVGVMGGAGTGTGKVDIKDVAVRDLSEKADAADLRKWQRTVELQLEACYDMTNFDLMVEKIRHERTPITEELWQGIMDNIQIDKDLHEKSRSLYHYLIMKLNTSLFNATTHVKDKKPLRFRGS